MLKADLDLGSYPDATAAINISGGTFNGTIDVADNDRVHLNITGGTFSEKPTRNTLFLAILPTKSKVNGSLRRS